MLVEEINLSAPEGYLAPVIHGLSGVHTPFLEWHLHSKDSGAEDETAMLTLPETAMIGPYPRVLGTINVDANAHAPARKVAARSCVVLLEPESLSVEAVADIVAATVSEEAEPDSGVASSFLGDPLTALGALDPEALKALSETLLSVAQPLGGGAISRRDVLRCLAYMAYFLRLAGNVGGLTGHADRGGECSAPLPVADIGRRSFRRRA